MEDSFLAARLWLRLGSWLEVPSSLQGEVGWFPVGTSYQPLGPRLAQWVGHPQAPTVAWRRALKTILTALEEGTWPLPVSSLQGLATGALGTVQDHRCMEVATRLQQRAWTGTCWGRVGGPVAPFIGFWTLKGIAQRSQLFSSHGAMFGIYG